MFECFGGWVDSNIWQVSPHYQSNLFKFPQTIQVYTAVGRLPPLLQPACSPPKSQRDLITLPEEERTRLIMRPLLPSLFQEEDKKRRKRVWWTFSSAATRSRATARWSG